MSEQETTRTTHACPQEECQCEDWPPTECPQCGVIMIGATPSDWYDHFGDECDTLGRLYCFASKENEAKA